VFQVCDGVRGPYVCVCVAVPHVWVRCALCLLVVLDI
jgi:hypothetical protein